MFMNNSQAPLYFSEQIKLKHDFQPAWYSLQRVLDNHLVDYGFLKGTVDIWCRDYMPVQIDRNRFVQFVYDPSYLKGSSKPKHDPLFVNRLNGIEAQDVDIILDGGNVVNGYGKAIISERVFDENPDLNSKKLIARLERTLEAEVIIIPCLCRDLDMTGHADGYVRFVNADTLIGNDRHLEYRSWTARMNKVLKENGIEYIDLPMFECPIGIKGKSAIGNYVNYLEIGNLIIMPIYEVRGNSDVEAYDVLSRAFPSRTIETANINEVGLEGGLLNCVSWNMEQ